MQFGTELLRCDRGAGRRSDVRARNVTGTSLHAIHSKRGSDFGEAHPTRYKYTQSELILHRTHLAWHMPLSHLKISFKFSEGPFLLIISTIFNFT
jgi:hypothetical protein